MQGRVGLTTNLKEGVGDAFQTWETFQKRDRKHVCYVTHRAALLIGNSQKEGSFGEDAFKICLLRVPFIVEVKPSS